MSVKEVAPDHITTGQFVLAVGGTVLGGIIVFILFRICRRIENQSGKAALSALKVGMIALAPFIVFVAAFFKISIPYHYAVIGMIVCSVIVLIWNIISFGPVGGILFSLLHIILGVFAGIGVGSLIVVIIAGGILYFVAGSGGGGASSGTTGSVPSHVRDVATDQIYYVVQGVNGMPYLPERGDCILRSSDYSGRYFDDNGNQYIAV